MVLVWGTSAKIASRDRPLLKQFQVLRENYWHSIIFFQIMVDFLLFLAVSFLHLLFIAVVLRATIAINRQEAL